jgi:hypothetical protein
VYAYDPACEEDVLRQGNFSSIEDILQFQTLPVVDPRAVSLVTREERRRYWAQNPDPFYMTCRSCKNSLVFSTLYRARRWWRTRAQHFIDLDGQPSLIAGKLLSAFQLSFESRRGTMLTGSFDISSVDPDSDRQLHLSEIAKLLFCLDGGELPFLALEFHNKSLVIVQFQLLLPGVRCFWRTIQLLYPDLVAKSFSLPPNVCDYSRVLNTRSAARINISIARPLRPSAVLPYTPCYRCDMSNLSRIIWNAGTFGERKNFWPFVCVGLRNADACGQRRRIARLSEGVPQNIRVALALSGFLRSFDKSRFAIYHNLVQPHNATVFAVTWNVVGRTKKSVDVHKKHTISVVKMLHTLEGFLGVTRNEHFRRVEVHNYFAMVRSHGMLKANGFFHPGLYFTLARSLELVAESKIHFDVIIRTRFDIFPAVPFQFIRMRREGGAMSSGVGSSVPPDRRSAVLGSPGSEATRALYAQPDDPYEYAIDFHASCDLDGVWWPQFAKFGEGKVLKHYADTRMKFFSWQVCDWLDVGTRNTVLHTGTIFNWVHETNAISAAQFVEHAFFLDRNLTYQPLQMFLKIMRQGGRFFG